ncbi:MAG: arginine--tRNA ligase [Chthoniobacteraceae bacterium]
METVQSLIAGKLRPALPAGISLEPQVTSTSDAKFGDYQTNAAMILAKQAKANPRQLAQEIIAKLDMGDMCETPEIAGAGFINFRLKPAWIAARLSEFSKDARLGVPAPAKVKKLVIDFSGPNVAKPMHVGHIRSTGIGDTLSRIASFIGHEVVRDNHIGDWGTQFGMLLVGWKTILDKEALAADPLGEMERIYKLISAKSREDEATHKSVQQELVKLQNGDEENLALWHEMIRLSQVQFDDIYTRLGVKFDVTLGESFYNPQLKDVVQRLADLGIARQSEGAWCVFSDHTLPEKEDPFLVQRDGEWMDVPALVQKTDGASNYATTDLATLEYRLKEWVPDEIIYVTDGRQQLHLRQVFAIFRRWHPDVKVRLEHIWFGTILGEDNKPFKTRSGESVRLADVLDEAVARAFKIVTEKSPEMPEAERQEIARIVGIGAVKYADLVPSRQNDYVFSWDKMLSMQGNTAPYLQNAYVRIQSIFRKAAESGVVVDVRAWEGGTFPYSLSEAAEFTLAKKLFLFGEIVPLVLDDYRPNVLANYLYELANTFHSFYEACPVLKSEEPARSSRLALCALTARVLKQGLELLGIQVPSRM